MTANIDKVGGAGTAKFADKAIQAYCKNSIREIACQGRGKETDVKMPDEVKEAQKSLISFSGRFLEFFDLVDCLKETSLLYLPCAHK